MRLRALAVLALWLAFSTAAALAQTVAARTTVIRGVVSDAVTNEPLRRVSLVATMGDTIVASTATAADGTFALSVPARGDGVSIEASKARYATARLYVPVAAAADDVAELQVPMVRGASISGRVVDTSGSTPTAFVRPTLQRVAADGTLSTASPATVTFPAPADPEGLFRFAGLTAGRYAVSFQIGWWMRAAPPAPVIVDVSAGQEADGITIVADVRPSIGPDTGPRNGRGTIRGRVWTVEGAPLAAASVSAGNQTVGWNATTDADGRFEFNGVPPGTFTVTAIKPGYRLAIVPEDRSFARVTIGAADTVDIDLTLVRNGIISGIVTDEYGDPLQNARVRVMTPGGVNAGAPVPGLPAVATDDRGRFRVTDIAPGAYLVSASSDESAGGEDRYVPVYYPGTRDRAFAQPIVVAAGAHVDTIAITLTPAPVGRISGTALTSTGGVASGSVFLTSTDDTAFDLRTGAVGQTGEFAFAGLPPGGYVIELATTAVAAGRELAAESITVTGGEHPVILRTRPFGSVTGRLRLEGAAGRSMADYSVAARRLVGTASRSDGAHTFSGPFGDGTRFEVAEVWGLSRLQFTTRDETWYLKSIRINGVEAVDEPFDFGVDGHAYEDVEVTFAADPAAIAGQVFDERGLPAPGVTVLVFSPDASRWFAGSRWIKSVRADTLGTFSVRGLPPGDYYTVAVDVVDRAFAADPAKLLGETAGGATRIAAPAGLVQSPALRLLRR